MATIIFTALGTLIGGPIGGSIGAVIGGQVDSAIIGGSGNIQGPRLTDLTVSTSVYGAPMPRHFGAMRVAGAIIWATDLVEHSATQGGGKNSPSVTTYSYTSSFAVALASRPLQGVGRIWADGTLLRGSAGDLKVGGTMRFYKGDGNQMPDPLIASAEGPACPGFRGRAYVVFEDLDLTNYGNRIPALTFEVFADNGPLNLAQMFIGLLDGVSANVPLTGITGFSCEGPFKDTLAKFQPVFAMYVDADGSQITIAPALSQTSPIALSDAAATETANDFGSKTGTSRARAALPTDPPRLLRYYDTGLDYQPGAQRAQGQPAPGKPRTIQMPAAMSAANAFLLVSQAATNANWARETLAWRGAALDPAVAPGKSVTVPGEAGLWAVNQWELRKNGVEVMLERLAPAAADATIATSGGSGYITPDLPIGASALVAYHLPWNGSGSADAAAPFAAVSSAGAGWQGAALYVDQGNGALSPIGNSGRLRATVGSTITALASASPLMFDRSSTVNVQLLGAEMALVGATPDQLIAGANQALIGNEIIQFAIAVALGGGVWQLAGLLRGRGGTEGNITGHAIGENFVLLDTTPVALNPALIGNSQPARIAALGLGDASAVEAGITNWGITLQPLSPVHPLSATASDGTLTMSWTRRARGAYVWMDGVDVPLVEESEAYQVSYGSPSSPLTAWTTPSPSITLAPATLASLTATLAHGAFYVQQVGTYGTSNALFLTQLP